MGILNATPDSFFDQGSCFGLEKALEKGKAILEEGADIIDIGGVSTRPGAEDVSYEEEKRRTLPLIKALSTFASLKKVAISIDTSNPNIAEKAIEEGATLINDIRGFDNPEMRKVAKKSHARLCVMHMQGTPKTMQHHPIYLRGVIVELMEWFDKRIDLLLGEGIDSSQIILDPGIGFGKTLEDNLTILKNLSVFHSLGFPILIGLSRKSFQSKILNKPPTQLLSTTIALNTMSILEGAEIIRVHDVKEHRDVIDALHFLGKFETCPTTTLLHRCSRSSSSR